MLPKVIVDTIVSVAFLLPPLAPAPPPAMDTFGPASSAETIRLTGGGAGPVGEERPDPPPTSARRGAAREGSGGDDPAGPWPRD